MRLTRLWGITGALVLASCAPAWASDHLTRINEVSLSAAGNPAAQYVELRDSVAEPFPLAPYRLVIYSATGMRLGAQTVSTPLGTSPYLISTAAADGVFRTTADTRLTVPLPRPAGQLCFTRGIIETRIHCLAYGGASTLSSEGGSQSGTSPPDCRALERTTAGRYRLGAPTPNAANEAASPTTACQAAATDTTPPTQRVALRRRRDVDKIVLRVRLNETAALTVSGFARIAGTSRKLRFRTVRKQVGAGILTRVVLKLRRSRRVAVKEAIAEGKVVRARVRIHAKDGRGNASVRNRRIRLVN